MSSISANIVVDSNPINIVVEPVTQVGVSVETTNLSIITSGGVGNPGGNINELQYNTGSGFGGIPSVIYDGSGLVIQQPTQIENIQVTQSANLGNVANLTITGGTNGYVLQTDGTGNLSWVAGAGGGGNGTPGGANTQIQYNDEGLFGGNVGFTFNETTGDVNIPGIVNADGSGLSNIVGANVTGTVANATFANSAGSANTANIANVANTANAVAGANVTGQVANALIAGTVYTNAQPNITSVGTLTGLGVNGNITAANITANTGVFTGNGSGLSSLVGANVTGTVANATFATSAGSANTAGTVTTNAQPNITSVGTLSNLTVSGTTSTGTLIITSGNSVALGNGATATNNNFAVAIGLSSFAGYRSVAVGRSASAATSGRQDSVAVGWSSKATSSRSVSVGFSAGQQLGYNPGNFNTFIGANTGRLGDANVPGGIVSVGSAAGELVRGGSTVAIGENAGIGMLGNDRDSNVDIGQDDRAIAIGLQSGKQNQGSDAIAIGAFSGLIDQGSNTIAIGRSAGTNSQANNSIIINATGSNLEASTANALFVKPIRNLANNDVLMYDATTGEITYDALANYSGNVNANNVNASTFVVLANDSAANIANITGVAGAMITVNDQDYQPAYWSVTDSVWKYVSNRANV